MYNASELCHCNHPSLKKCQPTTHYFTTSVQLPGCVRASQISKSLWLRISISSLAFVQSDENHGSRIFFPGIQKKSLWFHYECLCIFKEVTPQLWFSKFRAESQRLVSFFFFITEIIISDQATWLHQCADREQVSSSKCAKYKLFHI